MHVIQRQPAANVDDTTDILRVQTQRRKKDLDISPIPRHGTMLQPRPERFVVGSSLHLKRQKTTVLLDDGEYTGPLRFKPFESQEFTVSVFENHGEIIANLAPSRYICGMPSPEFSS